MKRRDFLKNIILAGTGLTIAPNYILGKQAKTLEEVYNGLPRKIQDKILDDGDKFAENFLVVRTAKKIDASIDTVIIEDEDMKWEYLAYSTDDNKIHKKNAKSSLLIKQYLQGSPIRLIGIAHEKLHSEQDKFNKYDPFITLIMNNSVRTQNGISLTYNNEVINYLRKNHGENLNQRQMEGIVNRTVFNYTSDYDRTMIFNEIQCYTFLDCFSSGKEMRNSFLSEPIYASALDKVTEKEFEKAFEANSILLGLSSGKFKKVVGLKEAAGILGKYDVNLDGFYKKVLEIAGSERNAAINQAKLMKEDYIKQSNELRRYIGNRIVEEYGGVRLLPKK